MITGSNYWLVLENRKCNFRKSKNRLRHFFLIFCTDSAPVVRFSLAITVFPGTRNGSSRPLCEQGQFASGSETLPKNLRCEHPAISTRSRAWLWLVKITIHDKDKDTRPYHNTVAEQTCHGVSVGPRWILTDARCCHHAHLYAAITSTLKKSDKILYCVQNTCLIYKYLYASWPPRWNFFSRAAREILPSQSKFDSLSHFLEFSLRFPKFSRLPQVDYVLMNKFM